jgi:hypothetical protein
MPLIPTHDSLNPPTQGNSSQSPQPANIPPLSFPPNKPLFYKVLDSHVETPLVRGHGYWRPHNGTSVSRVETLRSRGSRGLCGSRTL